jgi:hypothetical protein
MLNQGVDVPDKTIAVFVNNENKTLGLTQHRVTEILHRPPKKRSWFTPHFYRCLPLVIGNQQGYVISSEFDFAIEWNGGQKNEDLSIFLDGSPNFVQNFYPRIESHFGSGILTINPPFTLRTPPGVNLMTINPPNFVIPNITVMTGVVETDNLRRNFTFNLKVQVPNIRLVIPKGSPLAAFIPVPRNYCDDFSLKFAEELFEEEVIAEELKAAEDADIKRSTVEVTLPHGVGKSYFKGEDVYGNKFPDHQGPK